MEKLNIICVDDQRDVLSAIVKNLAPLTAHFNVEYCESGEEALDLINELDAAGEYIALVISDHVMPGKTGVELLTQVAEDPRFVFTKKIILTGQATHQDAIAAINSARVDSYLEKPWQADVLLSTARSLITEYIFDTGLDYQVWQESLDHNVVFRRLR